MKKIVKQLIVVIQREANLLMERLSYLHRRRRRRRRRRHHHHHHLHLDVSDVYLQKN